MRIFSVVALLLLALPAQAAELALKPVKVAPDVYAVIGDLGGQSYENDGLNNNLAFVVSDAGVLVINSGATARIARALHAAIAKVTPQPVKWVVNLNSQNHCWHGNDYFRAQGAAILAHKEADRVMRDLGAGQLESNRNLLKEKAAGTVLAYPTQLFTERHELQLGKTPVQLLHFGPAHTPGDIAVWLPQQKIVFAGDIIYVERMLAVIPLSNTRSWVQAFDGVARLNPKIVVANHGRPTDLKHARRDTRDYLTTIRAGVKRALDKNDSLQDAVEKTDQSRFKYLANFDLLARRNVNQVYLEMEQESF